MTGIDLMWDHNRFKKYQTRIEKVGNAIAWSHTSHLLTEKYSLSNSSYEIVISKGQRFV